MLAVDGRPYQAQYQGGEEKTAEDINTLLRHQQLDVANRDPCLGDHVATVGVSRD